MENRLFFNTENNQYYYNDNDGNIYKAGDTSTFCDAKSVNDIIPKDYLVKSGYNQLTLVVTQACNLRCTYCIYSGNYNNFRKHSNKFMKKETAFNAVDYYFKQMKTTIKTRPLMIPTISFYGGEPLLNFELIKAVVQYIKENYKQKVLYNMTTNMTIFNEEILDFLIENNFDISVSLNGDRLNNDRMRVTAEGNGTFDTIYKNLRRISLKDDDFYKNNVKIIVTYDKKTDMIQLNNYLEEDVLLKGKVALALPVKETFCDECETIQENIIFSNSMDCLEKSFFEKAKSGHYEKFSSLEKAIFIGPLLSILDRTRNNETYSAIPYTSMCVPGTKIAVDVDGTFHCCEKVNSKKPFGNVYSGIDFKKVEEYIDEINKFGEVYCQECKIKRMCILCFSDMVNDQGNLVLPHINYCNELEQAVKEQFTLYCTLMEHGVDIKRLCTGGVE